MVEAKDIRELLKGVEGVSAIADSIGEGEDLFERGLCSFGSVQLMLGLEERYGVEFPDHLLNRRSFSTIAVIRETVAGLVVPAAA